MKQQVGLETTRIAEGFSAYEANVVSPDKALAHEHVVKVAVVAQDAFLAVFARKNRIGRVDVNVGDERLERIVNDITLGAVREEMTETMHVMVHLHN